MKRISWVKVVQAAVYLIFIILTINAFIVSFSKVHINSQTSLEPYINDANIQTEVLKANRGTIYDNNGEIIAQNITTYNIVCILDESRPAPEGQVAYVDDIAKTAQVFSEILGGEVGYYSDLLSKDVYQTELGTYGRNITIEQKELIEEYELNGVEFNESVERYYPFNTFASNLIGFASGDENGNPVGMMGLELTHNEEMTGIDGLRTYQSDKNGIVLPGMYEEIIEPKHGDDIYLTLNKGIQESLENAFIETVDIHGASKIWGSVMDVDTGEILAWGQYPSFDPNVKEINDYNNYGSQYAYEAGSVVKVITYAAAINEGAYNGEQLYNSEPFCFVANGYTPERTYGSDAIACINNSRKQVFGNISLNEGLYLSSNVATATLITEVITPTIFEDYIDGFGFFENVDTDRIPEVEGTKNYTWPFDKLALSYGQGSATTMLQQLQAYSAILGDGTIIKPYYVDSIKDSETNDILYQATTTKGEQIISPEAAKAVQELMYGVVYDEIGTARFYAIPEIEIVAKTGTSQVAEDGGYSDSLVLSSILIGLPADDPKYLIYYAFESEYTINLHYYTSPVQNIIRNVAMYNTININNSNTEYINIEEYEMYDFTNNTVDYAIKKLDGKTTNIEIIGNKNTIIEQWPLPEHSLVTNQRVFLLTDKENMVMPDMTGWSRKDVSEFWAITGVPTLISGEGVVVTQSIPENTTIDENSLLQVELE